MSGFQGADLELAFKLKSGAGTIISLNAVALDSMQFSSEPVPEPNSGMLLILGISVLGLRRWRADGRGQTIAWFVVR